MAAAPLAEVSPLTLEQLAEAVGLWRSVKHYEKMGVRMVLVSPGDPIRVRPVGQAVDVIVTPVYTKGV